MTYPMHPLLELNQRIDQISEEIDRITTSDNAKVKAQAGVELHAKLRLAKIEFDAYPREAHDELAAQVHNNLTDTVDSYSPKSSHWTIPTTRRRYD